MSEQAPNHVENKEAPASISVDRTDLEDLASWAKQGEGDIRFMNDPAMAVEQLKKIYFKVQALLEKK